MATRYRKLLVQLEFEEPVKPDTVVDIIKMGNYNFVNIVGQNIKNICFHSGYSHDSTGKAN